MNQESPMAVDLLLHSSWTSRGCREYFKKISQVVCHPICTYVTNLLLSMKKPTKRILGVDTVCIPRFILKNSWCSLSCTWNLDCEYVLHLHTSCQMESRLRVCIICSYILSNGFNTVVSTFYIFIHHVHGVQSASTYYISIPCLCL